MVSSERGPETHRPAGEEKHLWLRIESLHTAPMVSHWPWWETCNRVSLASTIPGPRLH